VQKQREAPPALLLLAALVGFPAGQAQSLRDERKLAGESRGLRSPLTLPRAPPVSRAVSPTFPVGRHPMQVMAPHEAQIRSMHATIFAEPGTHVGDEHSQVSVI
jgi:hypothetical protein